MVFFGSRMLDSASEQKCLGCLVESPFNLPTVFWSDHIGQVKNQAISGGTAIWYLVPVFGPQGL